MSIWTKSCLSNMWKANLKLWNSHQNHLSLQMMTSMLCVMLLALFHESLRKDSKSQLVIIPIGEITYYAWKKMIESTEEDQEGTYIKYTKRWIHVIDRGGLFHINDEVYVFFHEIERLVRKFLKLVAQDVEQSKQEIMDEVTSDTNVQFYWSMICWPWRRCWTSTSGGDSPAMAHSTRILNSWGFCWTIQAGN